MADSRDYAYCVGVLEQTLVGLKTEVDTEHLSHEVLQRIFKDASELCSQHYVTLDILEEVIER